MSHGVAIGASRVYGLPVNKQERCELKARMRKVMAEVGRPRAVAECPTYSYAEIGQVISLAGEGVVVGDICQQTGMEALDVRSILRMYTGRLAKRAEMTYRRRGTGKVGRPRSLTSAQEAAVYQLRDKGMMPEAIARKLRVGVGAVRWVLETRDP